MGVHSVEKKQLSARGMLAKIRSTFAEIPEPPKDNRGLKSKIPLVDCLMSGLALFGLKFPSLLQFDHGFDDDAVKHNLNTLYLTFPNFWLDRPDSMEANARRRREPDAGNPEWGCRSRATQQSPHRVGNVKLKIWECQEWYKSC